MTDRIDGSREPGAPHWVRASLDLAVADWPADRDFWSRLTGWPPSASSGESGEVAALRPTVGDAYLRVLRLEGAPSRIHLDLHVADLDCAAARALSLGARPVLDRRPDDGRALVSPAGLVFGLITEPCGEVPPPATWLRAGTRPVSYRSRLSQVCLDVPGTVFETEVRFWTAFIARPARVFDVSADFVALDRPPDQPLRLILQRLGRDDAGLLARAHLEWWTDDLRAEVERHLAAGARREARDASGPYWRVLRDPGDLPYCVIARDPVTGRSIA